jgi:glutathione synthase
MALSLLFIVDPLDELKAYKDSSVAMMREAAGRGHRVFAATPSELAATENSVTAHAHELRVSADNAGWYDDLGATEHAVAGFDAVLMRKDPPFDMEYLYSTYLLEAAEREGARVFNRPRAIRDHNEKLAIGRFAQFIAPSLVTRDPGELQAFVDAEGDVIVKPLDGMGGTSIFRVRRDDPNRNAILEAVGQQGARTVMVQRYLPEIAEGDKRVLLIAGEPVPYALARIPKAGETRGNLAAGGRGVARELSARDREIAETLGPALWAEGLLLVGLDVIGACLTEVNVTSPTCFVEIAAQTGFDVAGMFADALVREASKR